MSSATLPISGIFVYLRERSAKGSGCAGHLIHRGAVPLPLKGKDNAPLMMRLGFHYRALLAIADLIHRGAVPLPLKGKA